MCAFWSSHLKGGFRNSKFKCFRIHSFRKKRKSLIITQILCNDISFILISYKGVTSKGAKTLKFSSMYNPLYNTHVKPYSSFLYLILPIIIKMYNGVTKLATGITCNLTNFPDKAYIVYKRWIYCKFKVLYNNQKQRNVD